MAGGGGGGGGGRNLDGGETELAIESKVNALAVDYVVTK